MLKISRYNHFFPLPDGRQIAYNCYTGNLGVMEKEKFQHYLFLKENGNELKALCSEQKHKELINRLRLGEFIINDKIGEEKKVPYKFLTSRYNSSTLSLVIGVTFDCNFNCPSCKIPQRNFMLPEIVDVILNFTEEKAKNLNEIKVRWFGGEPLLALDIMEDFTTTFLEICQEYNLLYSADMLSNGYLLTKDVGKKLKELKIDDIQVTLDGPKETHNKRRFSKETEDTYSAILQNIKDNQDELNFTIRVNLEENNNLKDVARILEVLKGKGLHKNRIHFAPFDSQVSVCQDFSDTCFYNQPWNEKWRNIYKLVFQYGFIPKKIPLPLLNFCYAHFNNLFIFDPKGNLYKCTYEVGEKERNYGNVRTAIDKFSPKFFPYSFRDPFKDQDCLNCSVSPLCLGGCAYRVVREEKTKGENCQKWYDNISSMIELIYLAKVSGQMK